MRRRRPISLLMFERVLTWDPLLRLGGLVVAGGCCSSWVMTLCSNFSNFTSNRNLPWRWWCTLCLQTVLLTVTLQKRCENTSKYGVRYWCWSGDDNHRWRKASVNSTEQFIISSWQGGKVAFIGFLERGRRLYVEWEKVQFLDIHRIIVRIVEIYAIL